MIIESQVSLTGQIQIAIDLFQLCWLTLNLTQIDDPLSYSKGITVHLQ